MIPFLDFISFLLNWINTYCFFMVLGCFLNIKGRFPVKIIAFLLCSFISNIIIYQNDITNIIGVLIGFIAFVFVFYHDSPVRKISTVVVFYPMVVSINYLALNFSTKVYFMWKGYPLIGYAEKVPTVLGTFIHMVSLMAAPAIWFAMYRILKHHTHESFDLLTNKMWLMIDSICVCVFTAVLFTLGFVTETLWNAYPICISCIFTIFGCLYTTIYIAKSVQTAYQLQAVQVKHQYYEEKMQEEERIRSIYHDMKNHLLVLENQSSTGKTKEMADKLYQEISGYEDFVHTGNDILDVIIREKSRLARVKGIDFCAAIDLSKVQFIDSLDISTIFGNSIDNAIEAAEKLPMEQRVVMIKAGIVHRFLMIVIENTCLNETPNKYKTSKSDTLLHGFGIGNMKKAVEKYGGECVASRADKKYTLKILIPVSGS